MAEALNWVSRITTIGLMMVLPTVGGNKLDAWLQTNYWGPVGLVVGLAMGAWQLVLIARSGPKAPRHTPTPTQQHKSAPPPTTPGETESKQ